MDVVKTIKPNQNGAKRFTEKYGERLVAVRYRKDQQQKRLFTTIELVVDARESFPHVNQEAVLALKNQQWVAVKLDFKEKNLREQIKQKKGRWSQANTVWVLQYQDAVALGITQRIVPGLAGQCHDIGIDI